MVLDNIADNIVPAKEFRRKYMLDLTSELSSTYGLDKKKSKEVASLIVDFFSRKVFKGEEVNLGFMSMFPKKIKSFIVKSHLKKTGHGTYYIGGSVRWAVKVSKAWQVKNRPKWSKF